jgi:hypothetical protein
MEHDYNVLYDTIKNIVEVETMPTMLEKWVADHKDEWEARGEARGKAESGRNMVLTALRTKFKKVPKDVEKSVLGMSDSIALESLLAQAIQSDTLDEFAEALR